MNYSRRPASGNRSVFRSPACQKREVPQIPALCKNGGCFNELGQARLKMVGMVDAGKKKTPPRKMSKDMGTDRGLTLIRV